jgi:LysR family transcriptional regulator, glycine cleavage system transcriptional activator
MRLPNLNGLRAFEAVARLRSMKAAAEELHVSPSAVSQLVRTLEEELGTTLFSRGHRALTLTPAGQTLMPAVANGYRLVADASARVRREPDGAILTVTTTTFFAESWLIPRLKAFQDAFPSVDLHVAAGAALASLRHGDADVAIRHGLGIYPGMQSELLLAPPVVPVAAPCLLAGRVRPTLPTDLLTWPKVHDADRRAWNDWFGFHGIANNEPARGPSFDDAALLGAAIRYGQGVGLLPLPAVEMLEARSELVRLGEPAVIGELGYYLVIPVDAHRRPLLVRFREWIIKEADQCGGCLSASTASADDVSE